MAEPHRQGQWTVDPFHSAAIDQHILTQQIVEFQATVPGYRMNAPMQTCGDLLQQRGFT